MSRRAGLTTPPGRRAWTRVGTLAFAAHVYYELLAGVAMPLAPRSGPWPVAALVGGGTAWVIRAADREPPRRDAGFSLLNGAFLSAVLGHFATWPRRPDVALPWLKECEGLDGRLMPAYNVILYVSGAAAVAGILETRRGGAWGLLLPPVLVPVFVHQAPREYARRVRQAQQRPRWWNRRLQNVG